MKLILMQPQLRVFDSEHCMRAISSQLQTLGETFSKADIIVLPEHFLFTTDPEIYEDFVRSIALQYTCNVIGGSFHDVRNGRRVNRGIAVNADGSVAGEYEKLRPYAEERKHVDPGTKLGEFRLAGMNILVLVCADFWFSDLYYRAGVLPDLVLVPALSVTRKPTPDYSRDLWRHLAVTRAYEFGVYVGISDWGHPSELPTLFTAGVGGFADPTGMSPSHFFTPIGGSGIAVYEIDFDALERFRTDRRERGFFWRE